MKIGKRFLVSCLIAIMFVSNSITTLAFESTQELINNKKNTILQIVVFAQDKEGTEYPVQGGVGFFIGKGEDGVEYLVSAKEVTDVTEEMCNEMISVYESLYSETKQENEQPIELEYIVRAVVKKDVMIDVSLVAESEEMGFSVWKLSQKLYDRQPLILYDQPVTKLTGEASIALGFLDVASLENPIYYTMDDVVAKEGIFTGDTRESDVSYVSHNMEVIPGMTGGPILTEDGYVVSINQKKRSQSGYYGIQISELISVLEAMGLPYITLTDVEEQEAAELAAIVHKENLQGIIAEAESLDRKKFTKKTYEIMLSVLANANEINSWEQATQREVDEAEMALKDAMDGLKEKVPVSTIAWISGSSCVILTLVGVIVWLATKPARERRKQRKIEEYTVTENAPIFTEPKMQKEDYRNLVGRRSESIMTGPFVEKKISCNNVFAGDETTVFQQESDLGIIAERPALGYLIRRKTCEKIMITHNEFVLGKDPSQTDYCVSGNSAISRAHAVIIFAGEKVGVTDKNATNGTFVNGIRVAPFQQIPLKEGDILKLADEDFEFRKS